MHKTLKSGFAVATAAAALFSMGATLSTSVQAADEMTVHCVGVNSCKGTADCATTAHSCKGQNSCKGQGFKALSAAECFKGNGVIGDIKG